MKFPAMPSPPRLFAGGAAALACYKLGRLSVTHSLLDLILVFTYAGVMVVWIVLDIHRQKALLYALEAERQLRDLAFLRELQSMRDSMMRATLWPPPPRSPN